MISSREAETMTYLAYKAEVWKRLLQFWLDRGDSDFVRQRIEACSAQHALWAAKEWLP